MRILTVGPWFSPHLQRPLRWLSSAGAEVLFLGDGDPFPEGMPGYRFIPFPHHDQGAELLAALQRIRNTFQPDAVHVHWIDPRAWLCLKAGLKPLVLSAWGSDINSLFEAGHDEALKGIIGEALAGADLTIVDAPTMAEKCTALAGRKIATSFLHLGLDTSRFRADQGEARRRWRERLGIAADAVVLLSPRGWGESNGHHLIQEAFAKALPHCRNHAVLLFKIFNRTSFSESPRYEMELRRRGIELGISGRLRWMEELPEAELPEIYAACDVVVNYPLRDTLPITLMESAASGRCAITALLPSYRGTFVERHMRSFTPGRDHELAQAMIELIEMSPSQRGALAVSARQEVVERFDESIYRFGIIRLYSELSAR